MKRHEVPGGNIYRITPGASQAWIDVKIVCEVFGDKVAKPDDADRFDLKGHVVRWEIGPKRFRSEIALKRELERLCRDRTNWTRDADGRETPARIIIQTNSGIVYDDVAVTIDAVTKAGFKNVAFGGELAAGK